MPGTKTGEVELCIKASKSALMTRQERLRSMSSKAGVVRPSEATHNQRARSQSEHARRRHCRRHAAPAWTEAQSRTRMHDSATPAVRCRAHAVDTWASSQAQRRVEEMQCCESACRTLHGKRSATTATSPSPHSGCRIASGVGALTLARPRCSPPPGDARPVPRRMVQRRWAGASRAAIAAGMPDCACLFWMRAQIGRSVCRPGSYCALVPGPRC